MPTAFQTREVKFPGRRGLVIDSFGQPVRPSVRLPSHGKVSRLRVQLLKDPIQKFFAPLEKIAKLPSIGMVNLLHQSSPIRFQQLGQQLCFVHRQPEIHELIHGEFLSLRLVELSCQVIVGRSNLARQVAQTMHEGRAQPDLLSRMKMQTAGPARNAVPSSVEIAMPPHCRGT